MEMINSVPPIASASKIVACRGGERCERHTQEAVILLLALFFVLLGPFPHKRFSTDQVSPCGLALSRSLSLRSRSARTPGGVHQSLRDHSRRASLLQILWPAVLLRRPPLTCLAKKVNIFPSSPLLLPSFLPPHPFCLAFRWLSACLRCEPLFSALFLWVVW